MEDDRTARRAIATLLKLRGFAVSEAGTLAEGGSAAAAGESGESHDWLLLDLMLPDGNGVELLRRVRAGEFPGMKVCVITGCAATVLEEVRRLKPEHLFTKPLDVDRLITSLEK